jgi:hypothetical protein
MRGRKPCPLSIGSHDRCILQEVARSETLPWYQVRIFRMSAQAVEAILVTMEQVDLINSPIRLSQPSRMPPGGGSGCQAGPG